jgi:23S rRNA-/tRNA-specific pseudouridylate synthase
MLCLNMCVCVCLRVYRTYEAILCGIPETSTGKIQGKIGRDVKNRLKMAMVNHMHF